VCVGRGGGGCAGVSVPVGAEGSGRDRRVVEVCGSGGGGGSGFGCGRRYGRFRVGCPAAAPVAGGGVAPLCEGGGLLGGAVVSGVPGSASLPVSRWVGPCVASRPPGVALLTAWLTAACARGGGRRFTPEPAPACLPFFAGGRAGAGSSGRGRSWGFACRNLALGRAGDGLWSESRPGVGLCCRKRDHAVSFAGAGASKARVTV
jgi:hypothetical protein